MKTITVAKKYEAYVDDEDFSIVSQYTWTIASGYAIASGTNILMHRLVLGTPASMSTDHINHNRLDNRKVNLRVCSRGQNVRNNRPFAASGYKGVYPNFNKWNARIHHKGKSRFLGTHSTPELAADAYNEAARELFGEFAYQNKIKEKQV